MFTRFETISRSASAGDVSGRLARESAHRKIACGPGRVRASGRIHTVQGNRLSRFFNPCASRADAPAVAYESVASARIPMTTAGNEYRFGSGPRKKSGPAPGVQRLARSYAPGDRRGSPFANAKTPFPRGKLAQTAIDVFAGGFLAAFASLLGLAIAAAPLILFMG